MKAVPESDRLVGLVLGGAYQLVGCIGEGGMGAVYEAHHLRMQKRVAVKLLHRSNTRHPDALERFHLEAMIASRLGHPHLVNVVDFGTSPDGEPYLVMEFLEGEDLERRLRRTGRMSLQTALQIARQAASAIAAVHAKGVVHRDLKPANIFLVQVPGEPDFVKVLDFGVSKIKAVHTKLTDASRALGTPEYMSPEQAAGARDEIDYRTDQWAMACIVWEMLSGQAPFSADDANAVFFQLTNLPPPPLAPMVPNLPSGLEPVLLRALSKSPTDRYPSIRAFARALETAAVGTWNEITPMASDITKIAALTDLVHVRRLAGRVRRALGLDRVFAAIGFGPRRLGLRRNVALAALAVMVGVVATALLLAGWRHGAMAAKPAAQPSSARPAFHSTSAVALPDDAATVTTNMAERPSTVHLTKAKLPRMKSSSTGDHAHRKTKSFAKAGGAGKRSRSSADGWRPKRLTVDDF